MQSEWKHSLSKSPFEQDQCLQQGKSEQKQRWLNRALNRHVPVQGALGDFCGVKHHLMLGMVISLDSQALCASATEPKGACNQICSFIPLAGGGPAVWWWICNVFTVNYEELLNWGGLLGGYQDKIKLRLIWSEGMSSNEAHTSSFLSSWLYTRKDRTL